MRSPTSSSTAAAKIVFLLLHPANPLIAAKMKSVTSNNSSALDPVARNTLRSPLSSEQLKGICPWV